MLTDEQIDDNWREANRHDDSWIPPIHQRFARAIEAAACAERDKRIAELEERNRDLHEDVQRFKKHALNEKAARLELERQLEEARNEALEEAAMRCDAEEKRGQHNMTCDIPKNHEFWNGGAMFAGQLAEEIRALKGEKE